MADPDTPPNSPPNSPPPGLGSSLAQLGHSLRDLFRAFKGEEALDDAEPSDTSSHENDPSQQLLLGAPESGFENAQRLTQHTPGWHIPHPHALASPSYAPAMTAFGIVFIALGAVTAWPLSVVGAVIFCLAMAKWIGELLHD